MRRTILVTTSALTLTALAACGGDNGGGGEAGGDYPSGPVTVVAPADPGSGWDLTARAVTADLAREGIVTTPLPVENRPGAVGTVFLAEMVERNAGRDDIIGATSLAMNVNTAMGQTEYSYEDVTMIAAISAEYYVVVTTADSEYQDLDSVVEAVSTDPGAVPVGAATDDQFPFSLIVDAGGGDASAINYVTYEGGGEQSTALLSGDIEVAVAGYSEFAPLLESGEVRGLAVIAEEQLEGVDIPTAVEQGYDVTIANWRGFYGPPDMPEEAVSYWQDVLEELVASDAWAETAARNQWTTNYLEGEELTAYVAAAQAQVDEGMELVGGGR